MHDTTVNPRPSEQYQTVPATKLNIVELSRRYALDAIDDRDELDRFQYCVIPNTEVGLCVVLRYENIPTELTEFLVDSLIPAHVAQAAIRRLFQLKDDEVAWVP